MSCATKDLRIFFKLGKSQKDTNKAEVGFGVEQLSGGFVRNAFNNINRIYDFGRFVAYINTESKKKCVEWGVVCQDFHPCEILSDLVSHLVTLARAHKFPSNYTATEHTGSKGYACFFVENRLISSDIDFSFNMLTRHFEGGRFGNIGLDANKKPVKQITVENITTFLEFVGNKSPLDLQWDDKNMGVSTNLFEWNDKAIYMSKHFSEDYQKLIDNHLKIESEPKQLVFAHEHSNDENAYLASLNQMYPQIEGVSEFYKTRCKVLFYICATIPEGWDSNERFPIPIKVQADGETIAPEKAFFPNFGSGPCVAKNKNQAGGEPKDIKTLTMLFNDIEPPPMPEPEPEPESDSEPDRASTKKTSTKSRDDDEAARSMREQKELRDQIEMLGGGRGGASGGAYLLYNIEGIQYDLFATIYILKAVKWLWYSYLMKRKDTLDNMDVLIEQGFTLLVFALLNDNVTTYVMDQVCTFVLYAGYLKSLRDARPNKEVLMGIMFFPFYVLFL